MKQKRDILFLCQFFFPEYVSSATLPFDTAKRLAEAGFTVDALCGYPKEYSTAGKVPLEEQVAKIHIRRLRYIQLRRTRHFGRIVNYLAFTGSVLFHLHLLKKYRLVIVYSNPPMLPLLSAWAKRLFGVKIVFVAYDVYPEIAVNTGVISDASHLAKAMRVVNRTIYDFSDRVVVLSNEMRNYLARHRAIDADRISVIPNWYEDQYAFLPYAASDSGLTRKYRGKFVVSYLGNMGTCQDIETVINCARILKSRKDICFLFAGHGNKVGYLRETISEENLDNIDVYDFLQGNDYLAILAISGCAVVSLAENVTGLCSPSKVYGYMMAGCPLIAIMDESDVVNDIRKWKIGCQIENGAADKMAGFIRELSASPERVADMKQRCRNLYQQKYTTDICTGQYVQMVEEIFSE